MKIRYNITEENYKEIAKKFKVLKNPIHLRILLVLKKDPKTNDEVHEILKKEGLYSYRESTYKALEKLVKSKFIKKEYDQERKKIIYFI